MALLKTKYDYDIVILGGGNAGVRAAENLAREGKRVAVVDPATIGGFEATHGYGERAPLVAAARLFATIKGAGEVGIRGGSVGYNYPTLREWSLTARATNTTKDRLEALNVHIYEAAARFVGPHEISIDGRRITGNQFLIATGSSPIIPPTIVGLKKADYLTPTDATDLLKPPKSIFIIGGGKTGVELAGLFASFGSIVYLAEIAPRLLPEEDADASALVEDFLRDRGGEVLTSTRVTAVGKDSLLQRITYLRGDVEHVAKVERILIAGGRTPNLDLGLENADVDYTPLGITVGANLQTSVRHIYAAGSVTGGVHTSEGAKLQAELASSLLLKRDKTTIDYSIVPSVIFGNPEVARVGVNEAEALRKDIVTRTIKIEFSDTVAGRAERSDGFVKLVCDRKGAVIGVTAVGIGAAEVINTAAIAVRSSMNASELALMPFGFGSAGEALQTAARRLLTEI